MFLFLSLGIDLRLTVGCQVQSVWQPGNSMRLKDLAVPNNSLHYPHNFLRKQQKC
jgi:hypothetical protein